MKLPRYYVFTKTLNVSDSKPLQIYDVLKGNISMRLTKSELKNIVKSCKTDFGNVSVNEKDELQLVDNTEYFMGILQKGVLSLKHRLQSRDKSITIRVLKTHSLVRDIRGNKSAYHSPISSIDICVMYPSHPNIYITLTYDGVYYNSYMDYSVLNEYANSHIKSETKNYLLKHKSMYQEYSFAKLLQDNFCDIMGIYQE